MVSGKGNVSKGKGAGTSLKTTSIPVSKIKRERVSDNEGSDDETSLPDIKHLESGRLPRIMSVINRSDDSGIILMEELDSLQMELEMLLNSVVLRSLELQKEVAGMTEKPPSPGKKGKFDEKSPKKSKDMVGKIKDPSTSIAQLKQLKAKTVPAKPVLQEGMVEEYFPVEVAKASTSKNDIPNKFWLSVEPYCAPFTDDDLKLLDDLIAAHNDDEEYFKIPPLGRHYTLRWAEDDLHHEQREGAQFADPKKKNITPVLSDDVQKLVDGAVAKTSNESGSGSALCGPVTQRLISALLEENIVTSSDDMMPVDGHDENAQSAGVKTAFTGPQAVALERRIRQELEEQGLFSLDESCASQEDEILKELKRCQGELRAISQHNVQQLKRLQRLAQDEMKCQETRKKLLSLDSEVLEIYRKVMLAKQKKRPLTKKEKESAWKALRDRESLVKHLDT